MGIDIDPVETVEELRAEKEESQANERLNAFVAVTVAILATFLGIFNVKDDNVVQAMLQAQADEVDHWAFYQARNIREEVMLATVEQLKVQRTYATSDEGRAAADASIAKYTAMAKSQGERKEEVRLKAEASKKRYNDLNFRDDQFDLSEAAMAIAIALLAITALTHFWWMYVVSLVPSVFGLVMGLAGLFEWDIHPDFLIKPLT